jgi:hypothetical protein
VCEAHDLVVAEVDADHPFGEAGLERLLYHEPAVREVRRATVEELVQAEPLGAASLRRVLNAQRPVVQLDLPDAGSAHAALLLQHERPPHRDPTRKLVAQLVMRAVEVRLGAPAHARRVDEHLLGRQPRDHVGVGADPDARLGHLAEQRVEQRAVEPALDRVDPDEYPVEAEQLPAHCVDRIVRVDHRLGGSTERREGREHAVEPAALFDRRLRADPVPLRTPEDPDSQAHAASIPGDR